ncbi:MAG: FHA domain-containing protein [Steroidobacteraceae bacterium]
MRGLQANDWLPALGEDGAALALPVAASLSRGQGIVPALAPIVAAARAAGSTSAAALWVATPSHLPVTAMSDLLRELRLAGCAVQGFVDAAVAVGAWLQRPGTALALDIGARSSVISVVVSEGEDYRLRRSVTLAMGAQDLHDAWLRMLGASMVRQWRFDPLDDPAHERALRLALPQLLESAAATGSAQLTLPVDGRELQLALSRDQFELAVHELLQGLGDALQALCAALGECELRMTADALRWPGLRAALARAGSRPLLALAPGAAARAVSLLPPAGGADGAVQYLTQLPAMSQPAPAEIAEWSDAGAGHAAEAPTHLVFRGRALAIGQGLVLGRDPGAGPGALQLPEGIAGLSRRHCTLLRTGAETVLVDHSRYGSFVDGMRVNGRALLAAGSVLRLGTPGIELPLIALGSTAGP